MRKSYWLFLFAISVGLFQSCDQDFNEDLPAEELIAPEIPPADLYTLPMALFQEAKMDSLVGGAAESRSLPKGNWIHAGINLLVWHGATVLNSVIPLAAFGEAVKQEPTLINGKQFLWSYQYSDPIVTQGDTYIINLTAEFINNRQDVEWVMTTSKVGGFTDFEWYSAVIATDYTVANFTINHQPENPESYLGIMIERDVAAENASIRYTNIIPGHENNGQYIEYRANTESTYNRAFDVQGGVDYFLQIQWHETTKIGRVKHSKHFNDNEWHCWDENQSDIDCN